MSRAEEYIKSYDIEWGKNGNFRNLWQETADLTFPRESNITTINYRGSEHKTLLDPTAVIDSKEMADGFLSAVIPIGEYFYKWNPSKDNIGGQSDDFDNWCARATDKQHRALFSSNFMAQESEFLRSFVVFGTGNIFSEWSIKAGGLNFKDYDIALYIMLANSKGMIDTMMIKFPYTARQCVQEWGEDKVGEKILEAYKDPKKIENSFPILHIVRPREERNPGYPEDPKNMDWESVYIDVEHKHLIDEGGFPDFPYHPARWMVTTGEIFGRGVGTEILPQIRVLQQMKGDLVQCGDKHNNPAVEKLESFDGEYKSFAGAVNDVQEIPSIVPIQGVQGNFPITKDIIEMEQEIIHKAFYKNVFNPITDLKGDRRTVLEIRERKLEGLRKAGQPVGRYQTEHLEPMLKRTLILLIDNGEIEPPPLGLETVEIEYLGLMSNALSSGQAAAYQKFVAIGLEMKEQVPEIMDNINVDEGFRNLGRQLGVRAEDIKSEDDRDAIRKARQAALQRQQALEAIQTGAQAYGQTTGAPESGSPAEAIMGTK
jgi:hypothetical protein